MWASAITWTNSPASIPTHWAMTASRIPYCASFQAKAVRVSWLLWFKMPFRTSFPSSLRWVTLKVML